MVGVGAMCGANAWAQDAGTRPPPLTASFSAEETYLETRSSPIDNGREAITRISPGLRYTTRSGSLQGSLDYTANLLYRRGRADTSGGELQNALNADFVAEAITNHAFIEARATMSQQAISAFGQQSVDGGPERNSNRTEVTNVSLTPWVRGSVGNLADYEVRVNLGVTETRASDAPRSNDGTASMTLKSPRSASMLGWAVSATQQKVGYQGAPTSENDRVNAAVTLTPVAELMVSLNAGRELNDDGVSPRVLVDTSGGGLRWSPSNRTSLDLGVDKRYFGHSSHLSFDHRMARSIWHYGYSHDVTTSADANGQPLTLYQTLYNQAASSISDPSEREQYVLAYIRSLGLDPNAVMPGGFLTSSVSLQRRQDVSVAWLGQRTTFNLQAFGSAIRALTNLSNTTDPSVGETVRQFGYSATLSYRLTPVVTVNLLGSQQKTLSTQTRPGNDLKSASLSLSNQIGPRTSAMLGARYTVFNSPTDPYRETAVSGSLSLRF